MSRKARLAACLLALAAPVAAFAQQAMPPSITLFAAGSLRAALTEIDAAFRQQTGIAVDASYGPSGKLRKDIEAGRRADVFASASIAHTDALKAQGLLADSRVFARNALCVVARPDAGISEANLLDALARPSLRLATSTPVSDPMGDYTWQFFRKADGVRPGLYALLDAKALRLSGATAPAANEKPPYVTAFEDDRADAYIMYCTNAASTRAALPHLQVLAIPQALNVESSYGIGARPDSATGERYVQFVLGPVGKRILKQHGFD
ncbi:molybdate ABC transporter substrate-binding protein [Noviherbaspirillum pedocola]|uniref:Molybdate ABC transporter substrate-binding protein n=1 Tax=Noviherbaspirillum pedocola TaxID=2801341 RepID=A0A934SWE8_9BURK|nr:molybdate ABC transporter substrate-binding protein [Noviherbaspirillum pedocola]MBK4736610.1 molybdate ABC transporter substrate-binding protein [Noviherbaspirillum pedocola]